MTSETSVPKRAMVLAAGYGKRMRPLTDDTPKPMLPVQGRAMLDHVLDRLEQVGVTHAVVNLHHLGEKIEAHLANRKRPEIVFSQEDDLLETGGGVRKALPLLGDEPFFVVNGDVFWLDGQFPALQRLAEAWDDSRMDALLLLQASINAWGYDGKAGDFLLTPEGRLMRRRERQIAPFIFAGVQILHPRSLEDTPEGAFSLNLLYDRAEAAERLWGVRHDGLWFHVGTPQALEEVDDALHLLSAAPIGT